MSGMISQTNMLKYAGRIGENQAKVGMMNKLVKATKTTQTQRTAVLTKLRAMLSEHYTPEIAETALKKSLFAGRDLGETRFAELDVNREIAGQGLTGEEIRIAITYAKQERAKLVANPGTSTDVLSKMLMKKLEEGPIKWPSNLKRDHGFVLGEVAKVVDEFVKVHGQSADNLLEHLAQTMVDRAGALKKETKSAFFKAAVTDMTARLLEAIVNDGVDAAINGKLTMGNLTRALAPNIQESAEQERTIRFGMVKTLAENMAATELTVTVDDTPATHSLKTLFDPQSGIWPKLSMTDRESAIRSFMKLHAQSHGYPDNVGLVLDHHKDAMQRTKHGAFTDAAMEGKSYDLTLHLRSLTAQTDDPVHLLTTLAHEMTHAYEYSLIHDTNQSKADIPAAIGERLAYDIETRKFTNGDPSATNYAKEQDHYVRDFSERAAVESEWAMLQFLTDPKASVADLVAATQDIQNGFSGKVRTESSGASLKHLTQLAERADSAFAKAKNYTDAAAVALRMGNLDVAADLLPKINFQKVAPHEQQWLSREIITELQEMLARPYAPQDAKLLALDHLPRFFATDLEATPEGERGARAEVLIGALTELAAQAKDPGVKKAMLITLAGLHHKTHTMDLPISNGPKHVKALVKLGTQLSGLFDGSQNRRDYEQAHTALVQLQKDALSVAGNKALVPRPQVLKTPLSNLETAITKLAQALD